LEEVDDNSSLSGVDGAASFVVFIVESSSSGADGSHFGTWDTVGVACGRLRLIQSQHGLMDLTAVDMIIENHYHTTINRCGEVQCVESK
jgi:hypothetical protein